MKKIVLLVLLMLPLSAIADEQGTAETNGFISRHAALSVEVAGRYDDRPDHIVLISADETTRIQSVVK
jgi:hypothetical protein